MLVLLVWIACVCCGLANMAPSRIVGWYRWVTAPLFPYRNLEWLISVLPKLVKYNQLWMPLLKHWWRMPWIVINIMTCRIPWINWILNMDCAAGVAFASIPSAYTHYCALWLCEWQSSADGASDKFPWWSYEGPITKGLCVFASAFLCRVGQSYGFVIQQLWCRWKDSLNLSI